MDTPEQQRNYNALCERIEMAYELWLKKCGFDASEAAWSAFFWAFRAGMLDTEQIKEPLPLGFYDRQ